MLLGVKLGVGAENIGSVNQRYALIILPPCCRARYSCSMIHGDAKSAECPCPARTRAGYPNECRQRGLPEPA